MPNVNHIGTHNYVNPPQAVIFGRAFTLAQVTELNQLYRGKGKIPVAWLAGDPAIKPPTKPGPDYAEKAADKVKAAVTKWKAEGEGNEDIITY